MLSVYMLMWWLSAYGVWFIQSRFPPHTNKSHMVSAGLGSFRVDEPLAIVLQGLRLGTAEWVAADTTPRWHFGNSVG
jgi:hypothetical protein